MKSLLTPFGRYFLLDRIARGGMAEIYRARYAMVDSGARLMAIKCMAPELSNEAQLLEMFKAEVKLLLGMNHPNIVQFYDFGDGSTTKIDGQKRPYIAMEYLQGQSLRQVLAGLRAHDDKRFPARPFSIQFALHIASQCCQALHYVHEFSEPITGAPMKVIHRDVNPQNIIVLYDGSVKLIDFGIAKTAFGAVTQTGLIKGTPAYLAPEQVKLSQHLDRRCDIFSLGVVVWEMLTGQRLFRAQDDRATMLKIAASDQHVKPPSKFNSTVPPGLDQVVLKALAHDPDERYTTAIEFEVDLKKAIDLQSIQLKPSIQNELGEFVRSLFAEDIKCETKMIRELNQQAEEILRSWGKSATGQDVEANVTSPEIHADFLSEPQVEAEAAALAVVEAEAQDRARAKLPKKREVKPEPHDDSTEPQSKKFEVESDKLPSSRGWKDLSLVSERQPTAQLTFEAPPQALSRRGSASFSESKGRRSKRKKLPVVPRKVWVAAAAIAAFYCFGYSLNFRGVSFDVFKNYARTRIPVAKPLTADLAETPPELTVVVPPVGESREIASPTLEKSDTAVQVLLNILPPGLGTQIRVNGRLIQDEASTATLELSSMKPFSVSISRPGFQDWFGSLDPTQLRKSIGNQPAADVRMIPKRYGLLKVQTGTSAEVTIMVQGIPWTLLTPIEGERLPVGTYSIRVVNQIRNVRRDFVVKIEEGKIKEIHEDL